MSGVVVSSPLALGAHIRRRRKQQVESIKSIAGKSGVGQRFVSELERGKPTVELKKVMDTLEAVGLELVVQEKVVSSATGYTSKKLGISIGENSSES